MSIDAIAWAKKQKTGSPTRKAVLVALADYADEHGKGWPSVGRLAEDTELSVRAVQNAIRELVEAEIIDRHERPGESGVTRSFLYHLPISGAKTRAQKTPKTRVHEVRGRVQDVRKGRVHLVRGEGASDDAGRAQEVHPHYIEPLPLTANGTSIEESKLSSHPKPSFGGTFDQFWEAYPSKVGKDAARRKFEQVRKSGRVTVPELIAAIERYKATKPKDREWCHPATWLNQGRWLDEPEPARPMNGRQITFRP